MGVELISEAIMFGAAQRVLATAWEGGRWGRYWSLGAGWAAGRLGGWGESQGAALGGAWGQVVHTS